MDESKGHILRAKNAIREASRTVLYRYHICTRAKTYRTAVRQSPETAEGEGTCTRQRQASRTAGCCLETRFVRTGVLYVFWQRNTNPSTILGYSTNRLNET